MISLTHILLFLDPWLIAPYRWPASAGAGYVLGTAILCLYCVVLGDAATLAACALNRRRLGHLRKEMDRHHALSELALRAGDKASYKAVNKQALDAFGHSFSLGGALFCASILPLPLALAWMDRRFAQAPLVLPVDLPLVGAKVHYLAAFLLLYMALRILYAWGMGRIETYRRLKARAMGAED